ncbi:MAG: tetratricopeptide repeat protein [Hyphomicrobiales bacterium]|nr:tetratricopeptide repeat protein [Hyphomicrobiales bacterium]MBV8825585.1 tetratricopeptide repeat protein [Hyphomicrobiales bacterium]MBV9430094.1 tetratricopeptide repeat protein [Bradyrhizobiaceae bacterium]
MVGDLRNRADMLLQAGDFANAIPLLRELIAASPADASLQRQLAGALDATGAIEDAIATYRRALALDPSDARTHDELGRLLGRRGDMAAAAEHLRAAAKLNPSLASARAALGDLLCREGRHAEGVAELEAALAHDPGNWPAALRLGTALTSLGAERQHEAMDCFRRVIALSPGNAVAHLQLGLAFWRRRDAAPAIALAERAARLDPKLAAAHGALGSMLRAAGRVPEAVASLRAALALNPDDPAACFHLGMCLSAAEGKAQREGVDYLRRAISLVPRNLEAHRQLAWVLAEADCHEEAGAAYRAALEIFPDDAVLRLGAAMATLPIVAEDAAVAERCRAEYAASLAKLEEFFAARRARGITPAQAREDADAVGTTQPFFLAYQGRDDTELQARYGRIVTGIMAAAYPQFAKAPSMPPPALGEPIRIGIVSGHLRGHSVLKIPVWGWASLIDRRRFRLLAYHTTGHPDGETARVRRSFERFVQGPLTVEQWCETIRADAPHVVIFPEIGMDPMTTRLAGLLLAPVQASSWGHPETSGFPTIDYFLSSELMEPPEADAYYTEKLVRLPNLGVAYVPPPIADSTVTREALGLRPDDIVFWCCQHLPKYLPEFDSVFPRIAREVANARFVFIASPRGEEVTARFQRRLARAFAAQGLDGARHVGMLGRLLTADFVGVARVSDVFLDSIGWSGCNSALECLDANLPIVTWPGPFMRGRHCAAILRMMGVTDTIAASVDEYIALAVRLARDAAWRAALRTRMAENRARLYADAAPVRALEAFIEKVVRM